MSVRWVDPIRTWFQDNKAPAFDRLRMADKDGSGILSGDTLAVSAARVQATVAGGVYGAVRVCEAWVQGPCVVVRVCLSVLLRAERGGRCVRVPTQGEKRP